MNIQEIFVDLLVISDQNVRKNANEVNGDADTSISDLAQSIETQGLINPISVSPIADGMYDVVAGQRRLLAVKSLGWTKISCTVASADMTDNEAKVHSLVENFQRQDNSYSDKVSAFSTLLKDHCKNDMNKLCKMVGVKRPTAERYVAMNKLPAEVLATLDVNADGKRLNLTAAMEVTKLPTHQMAAMATTLLGRSIAESQVILQSVRQNPTANAQQAMQLAVAAVEQHALRVAEDANLVEERTWRADTPWIHHPIDKNRYYEIINIEAAWATLMANGCLHKAGSGIHRNDFPPVPARAAKVGVPVVVGLKREREVIDIKDEL